MRAFREDGLLWEACVRELDGTIGIIAARADLDVQAETLLRLVPAPMSPPWKDSMTHISRFSGSRRSVRIGQLEPNACGSRNESLEDLHATVDSRFLPDMAVDKFADDRP